MEEISNRWVRAVRNEGPAAGRSAVDCAAEVLTRKAVEVTGPRHWCAWTGWRRPWV